MTIYADALSLHADLRHVVADVTWDESLAVLSALGPSMLMTAAVAVLVSRHAPSDVIADAAARVRDLRRPMRDDEEDVGEDEDRELYEWHTADFFHRRNAGQWHE